MVKPVLHLHPGDNVEVVCSDGLAIPRGHKRAIKEIIKGEAIVKFGHSIGVAKKTIGVHEHVHTHNVDYSINIDHRSVQSDVTSRQDFSQLPKTFLGFRRSSGNVGIRNYIVVAATVNCSATVVKRICQKIKNDFVVPAFIDDIVPITHSGGCAQAIGGLNYKVLNRTLAGWIFHSNVVGAIIVGLGCEGTTFDSVKESAISDQRFDAELPIELVGIQDSGGTNSAIGAGVQAYERLIQRVPPYQRTEESISHLNLALNCGGSDAFSSISANPLLGEVSDICCGLGAAVSLAEIPECHGAEALLKSRAANSDIQKKLDRLFTWWQEYALKNQVSLNNNLSPGNIEGGITTIIEKSLGAVTKGGRTLLKDVVDFAEPMRKKGFILMNTPGFDPVSVTGLVAGGSQIVAFTTGRGSVYGCSIAPTIKIATQSALFQRMCEDMDFDAGRVLAGSSFAEESATLYKFIIEVASGKRTKSELLGIGQEEFVPWSLGETL